MTKLSCPEHPFEANHDVMLCRGNRLARLMRDIRQVCGRATDREIRHALEYVAWRFGGPRPPHWMEIEWES